MASMSAKTGPMRIARRAHRLIEILRRAGGDLRQLCSIRRIV